MDMFHEVRNQIRAKVAHRRKVLAEKLRNSNTVDVDEKIIEETSGIRLVQEMLDHEVAPENKRRRQIAIASSEQEVWYRETLAAWATNHPEAGVNGDNNAGLYRFAMRFFVENVVLNTRNTVVNYGELTSQMDRLNDIDPVLASLNFQLQDIRELVSFNTAITHMESIRPMTPERDLGNGVLSRDIHSELEEGTEFNHDFKKYRNQRNTTIASKHMRRPNEGLEFNHD